MYPEEGFYDELGEKESSNNYSAQNGSNYLGKYQLGEAALVDAGYVAPDGNLYDNNYSGGWTGKDGVNSSSDFLNSPEAQELAVRELHKKYWQTIKNLGLDDYIGTTVNGVEKNQRGQIKLKKDFPCHAFPA